MKRSPIIQIFLLLLLIACKKEQPLFTLVPPDQSGVDFVNAIEETDSLNILTVEYMYHGGGVAIGDFNNDSLSDIFFTGNIVSNRLYLNEGRLRFRDVTGQAGVAAPGKWKAGVALADVNNDGWLDIYVCATIHKDSARRANMLFMNKGPGPDGVPRFLDEAAQYGVADTGYSQHAAFLDYDRDGDLDLYVLTNLESDKIPSVYRPRILDGTALNNDKLYRNNGNGSFTDVSKEAGILVEGYGLGIAVADINDDGWPDIYIGNDYVSNDILYINNGDGTFTNEIKDRLKHQSLFTMGIDIADVNNDLHPDIVTLDMLPENNLRRKTVSGAGATYYNYINNIEYNYEFQYMRNMLHVNLGNGTYSEVGQMAGIHQTEWSWSSLLADVDNDGHRDLLVTNGFPKDVTDRDYVMFKREVGAFNNQRSLLDSIPVLKIPNYAFQNRGDLLFADKTADWGLLRPSFSNGAAFADLDRDGDLDYVVNNINDPAFIYENNLYPGKDKSVVHYLRIALVPDGRQSTQGTKVTVRYAGGKKQFHHHTLYRGYLSTVEDFVHFGLGAANVADTVDIVWPDGRTSTLRNVAADQVLTVRQSEAAAPVTNPRLTSPRKSTLFTEVSAHLGIRYKHREWDKVDFYRQRTLPHKFSQAGPGLAVGDLNGDRLEDFIIGGSSLFNAMQFTQQPTGKFTAAELTKATGNKSEDEGLLLFDADGDGDLDLYAVSGSYEGEAGEPHYQDRLYINDGKGAFTLAPEALPQTLSSGSCARAADIDGDGDLDLFIGGRVVPGAYPVAPDSYLLQNNGGRFSDVTDQVAPGLRNIGMVTDALFTDYDNDGKTDLLVAGEFMAPTFFRNTGTGLTHDTRTGLARYTGWWNSLAGGDFDRDGDTDYIAGNLGQNNYYQFSETHPLRVYARDFDSNGSIDAIMSCYFKSESGEMKEYPAHFWDELYSQSPKFRNQFSSYKQYGKATMAELLAPYDTTGMIRLEAVFPFTSFLRNNGDGSFEVTPLARAVQVAPVNGMAILDVNLDGHLDVVLAGNDYGNEVFSGRYDAGMGMVLLGDGTGAFQTLSALHSGFLAAGDAKGLAAIVHRDGPLVVLTQNADSARVFRLAEKVPDPEIFTPEPLDSRAEFHHRDGKRQKTEFYYGSGYLSQSSRSMIVPAGVEKIIVHDFLGNSRTVEIGAAALSTNH